MSSLVETVTALESETKASRETIFAPGLRNVAANWYNDGTMVSNGDGLRRLENEKL